MDVHKLCFRLTKTVLGVPRPRKEDLVIDDGSEEDAYAKYRRPKEEMLLGKCLFFF
jgi:hypothetical protein